MANRVWFTGDFHDQHSKIISYTNRPFINSFDMHEQLVANYQEVVKPNDQVFLLGDMCFGSKKRFINLIEKLPGKKHFIRGNHKDYADKKELKKHFVWVKDYYDLWIQDKEAKGGKQLIVLMHYPIEQWRAKHFGSIHCCGHSHNTIVPTNKTINRVDVGVDAWNYYPVSYEQVKEEIKRRERLFKNET